MKHKVTFNGRSQAATPSRNGKDCAKEKRNPKPSQQPPNGTSNRTPPSRSATGNRRKPPAVEDDDELDLDEEDDEEDEEDEACSPERLFRGHKAANGVHASRDEEDDEDEDYEEDDEDSRRPKTRQQAEPISPLRSQGKGSPRKGVYLPDWAMDITRSEGEQKLLGNLDYWLGVVNVEKTRVGQRLHVRAKGRFLYVDRDGFSWYVSTCRQLGKKIYKSKNAVKGIVDRLRAKQFLFAEKHIRRDGSVALRLRLNWSRIEEAFQATEENDDEEPESLG